MRASLVVGLAVLVTACLPHAIPTDRAVELTRPGAASASAMALPRQLRVVEFNTHGVPGNEIAAAFRMDLVLRDADLIILEEAHRSDAHALRCSAACVLAKELGFSAAFAPGHVQDDGTDGVAIVSRAPILATEVIELPYIDVHINAGRRIALAATLLLDGKPVTVYAVHLENRVTVAERRRQLAPVLAHAARQPTPVIIAGDFNTSPFTWLAHVIPVPTGTQDDKLEALVRARGFDTPLARSGPTSHFLGMKLDAIYTRGFSTIAFTVDPARDISDHLALWAMLEAR